MARSASDPRARDWRASLLNNLGWTRFEAGELDEALSLFEEAALAKQIDLVQWMAAAGLIDSFIEEEIGECLVELGWPGEASSHFARAAALLEATGPGEEPHPERLARLRALQKNHAGPG